MLEALEPATADEAAVQEGLLGQVHPVVLGRGQPLSHDVGVGQRAAINNRYLYKIQSRSVNTGSFQVAHQFIGFQ
jgi:hypothetical protein